ncbi:MAG TPA: GGDEF domain-containing protein [Caulobacteraceae bacterium]|jgi:diguanylate cyclase
MADDVENTLRGPSAYTLAQAALKLMQEAKVWPTPLNFELWVHYAAQPEGALGQEIQRILKTGPVTEDVSEQLALEYLPRNKLNEQIRDAGDQLTRELLAVTKVIETARHDHVAYGKTLAGASEDLSSPKTDAPALKRLVDTLTDATRKVERASKTLEDRLHESTSEVTRLKGHLEQARRDAMTDALTNLANRKSFDEQLQSAVADAGQGRGFTLALIDIDHFKSFNDTWGHQTGDQVLRYVAAVIGRMAERPRFAARYGGEEFAVLFPGEDAAAVAAALDEVRQEIGSRALKRRSTNEDLGAVTISSGLAQFRPGETGASITDRADAALYASKHAGRNCVTNAEAVPAAA